MGTVLPIADRWFTRESVGDGITWLTEPHVHPLLRCNIWHVRGRDRDLLIDTGLGVASLRAELSELIDRPLTAIATHVHYDHVGSLHEFEDRRIHRLERDQMADYREIQWLLRAEIPEEVVEYFRTIGYPLEGETLLDALPHGDFDPAEYSIRSADAAPLDEGDLIDLGDRHFEVLHLPGHTPGSLGIWEAASATLFTGDAIYDGPLLDSLPESDLVSYRATMRRLRELTVRVVHGGHDKSFGRERLIELVDAYLSSRPA